jgi:hypothetical protein
MGAFLRRILWLASSLILPLGCYGSAVSVMDPLDPGEGSIPWYDESTGGVAPLQFSCDSSATPDELALPRLSHAQLEQTLKDAIALALPANANTIWANVSSTFSRYPNDVLMPAQGDLKGGYSRTDQSIQQTRIDAMYETAVAIAAELTSSATRMGNLMGGCATDTVTTNDLSCLEGFIGRWGSRVLRYPLSTADITYYAAIAGSTPVDRAAVADVVAALLLAPQTLYRVEHGTGTGSPAPLSAHELASRLSYQFWQRPPDDALWAAAQSGALLEETTYRAELARLTQSTQTRASLNQFVSQWLRLEELPNLDALNANPVFRAFAGADLPPATARGAMIDDVLASAHRTLTSGGSLSDFLTDRRSYATDGYLAGLYQVGTWDGVGEAPVLPSSERAGLLTRAAMLATGTPNTRPIHKGYLVRNALLCQQLGAPPPNVSDVPPASSGDLTTRQVVTQVTSSTSCSGCHVHINPPGFITERFDALGRERTEEKLFDDAGQLVASLPIDTQAAPQLQFGDTRVMSTAAELTRALDESKLLHSCFARHYFRFTQSRTEVPAKDGCLLSELETAARSGAPLEEVLQVVAASPSFKTKRFQ